MPITDEQLQAIENVYGQSQGPIANLLRDLIRDIREREATIAELRRPWADIRKEFESEDGVDAVRAVDALCKRANGHRNQVQGLERKVQVRDQTICEMDDELESVKQQLTELRKPVAAEANALLGNARKQITLSYENCAAGVVRAELAKLVLDAYDTLAQDCARYANAHEVMLAEMAGLRERIAQMGRQAEQSVEYATHRQAELEASRKRERQLRNICSLILEADDLAIAELKALGYDEPDTSARKLTEALRATLAASPAPVESAALAQPQPQGRTPEQYAIEHGRYLATAAREFMDACNAVWSAQQAVDEDETDTQNEADGLLNRLDEAKQSQCESWRALDNAIYEFTKRADRAYPLKRALAQPQGEQKEHRTCHSYPFCRCGFKPGSLTFVCEYLAEQETGNG